MIRAVERTAANATTISTLEINWRQNQRYPVVRDAIVCWNFYSTTIISISSVGTTVMVLLRKRNKGFRWCWRFIFNPNSKSSDIWSSCSGIKTFLPTKKK
jgi:hypothetical protein